MRLTQREVRKTFYYDPLTGILSWKDKKGPIKNGDEAGCIGVQGYKRVGVKFKTFLVHRIIWLYVYGYLPENQIDHINRIKTDNRIANLREVSIQCNTRNSSKRSDNTSGVTGVTFDKKRNKWCAQIVINKKNHSLGRYISFENAVCARLAGEQCVEWNGCDNESDAFLYVQKHINKEPVDYCRV